MSAIQSLVIEDASYVKDSSRLLNAEDQLAGMCMRQMGFSYTAHPAAPFAGPFSPINIEEVRKNGYGLHAPDATDPNLIGLSKDETSRFLLAYLGAESDHHSITLPTGGSALYVGSGCLSDARRDIYGDPSQGIYADLTAQFIRLKLAQAVQSASVYESAIRGWSSCMHSAGYSFSTPQAAHDAAALDKSPNAPKNEIAIALQDSECSQVAKLREIASNVAVMMTVHLDEKQLEWLQGCVEIRAQGVGRVEAMRLVLP